MRFHFYVTQRIYCGRIECIVWTTTPPVSEVQVAHFVTNDFAAGQIHAERYAAGRADTLNGVIQVLAAAR